MRIFSATLCILLLSCSSSFCAFAQNAGDQQILARLAGVADDLHRKLPNFSCSESVLSEEIQQGKVRHHARFTATVRAQRNSRGLLEEKLGTQTYEVNPFSALFHRIPSMPLYVSGGFSQALDYFSTEDHACFDYRISPNRIDFSPRSPLASTCKSSGVVGFALLDSSGNVTHVERTVTLEDARLRNQALFAAIDLAPVELNSQIFRLSHHVVAEMPADNGILRRFTADFSNCKLFTATITVTPAGNVIPAGPNP